MATVDLIQPPVPDYSLDVQFHYAYDSTGMDYLRGYLMRLVVSSMGDVFMQCAGFKPLLFSALCTLFLPGKRRLGARYLFLSLYSNDCFGSYCHQK